VGECRLTTIEIDIKPGSDPNSINLKSKGKIPVAVLTTDTFDATQVDWETVMFGPNGATEAHGRSHVKDIDGDGDADLVLHFKTQETGIACGDTEAALTGETFGGQAFTGTDSIVTVGCGVDGEEFFGTPLAINFTPTLLVDQLLVEVADAWLTDPTISLDIEITGINGGFERHGTDLIDVVDTNVFSSNGTVAQTVVDWTTDTTPQNVNEVYFVCVQVLRNATVLGLEHCGAFGPF